MAGKEPMMQYHTRNMPTRLNKRMRLLAVMRPEKYASMEAVLREALERGLSDIEKEEGIARAAAELQKVRGSK